MLKAVLYKYVSHNRYLENGGAGEKKILINFEMTPDREFFTFHITKPNSRISFRDIITTPLLKKVFPLTATQSIFENIRDKTLRFYSERKSTCCLCMFSDLNLQLIVCSNRNPNCDISVLLQHPVPWKVDTSTPSTMSPIPSDKTSPSAATTFSPRTVPESTPWLSWSRISTPSERP